MKYKFLFFLFVTPALFAQSIVIGIAGASGAGKTTLAKKLKESLGDHVSIICQDNYYKDLSHLSIRERAATNFDDPDSIDFNLLQRHLLELKQGKAIDLPTYDFVTHSRTKSTVKIQPKKITIIEGCLVFAVPEIREVCDMKLFVEADMDICLCRRIERDQKERGRTFPDIRDQYLKTVRPMFLKHIAPSKSFADLIIPNPNENELVLDFISRQLSQMITPTLTFNPPTGHPDA
ncbi:MAG: uridine kinase [Chlamydiales bacterium]|nr:uridine kinase [Chlamydiales bacterium]